MGSYIAKVRPTYWITKFADKERRAKFTLPKSPNSFFTTKYLNPDFKLKFMNHSRKQFGLNNTNRFSPIMFNNLFTPSHLAWCLQSGAEVVWFSLKIVMKTFHHSHLCGGTTDCESLIRHLQVCSLACKYFSGYPYPPQRPNILSSQC